MKRLVAFMIVLLVGLTALFFSERRQNSTPVSANAILEIAAHAQRDLARAPMRLTRLSDDQEIKIGNELAANYRITTEKPSPEEQALDAYISQVGAKLAAHAHRRLPYSFHLAPEHSFINAFSLPGGPVYVGEGLLDQMS